MCLLRRMNGRRGRRSPRSWRAWPSAGPRACLRSTATRPGNSCGGGFVSADELRAVVTSVIVDAVTVLTAPVAGEASVSGFRFEEPRAHWAGGLVRLDAARVFAEADERARRMARKGLGLESAGRPPVTSELLQRVLAGLRKLS